MDFMTISLHAGLKQSPRLVMNQTLKQAIELLQLSTVELYEKITLELAENPLQPESKKPYLGVFVMQKTKIKESFSSRYSKITADFILWFAGLFLWLYILNLGIGLFNLVPIPVCDGGRMLQIALMRFMSQEKADKIWKNVGVFFIALILINLVLGFVK